MTFREKLVQEHPEIDCCEFDCSCPSHYGYEKEFDCLNVGEIKSCGECWDREISEHEESNAVKDFIMQRFMRVE